MRLKRSPEPRARRDWGLPLEFNCHHESFLVLRITQLEVATIGFFLLNQDVHDFPSMKQKPLVDTLVSKKPTNLSSNKQVNLMAMISPWDKINQGMQCHSSSKKYASLDSNG